MLTQGGDCIQICVIVVIQLIFIGFDDSVFNVFLRVVRTDGHISSTGKSNFDHWVADAVSGFDLNFSLFGDSFQKNIIEQRFKNKTVFRYDLFA